MIFPFYIARKIYTGGDQNNKVSKPAIKIATLGVAIGLSVMIISVSVVLGFKHSIRDKVIGFGSHIIVTNFLSLESSEQYPIAINKDFIKHLEQVDGVKKVERYVYTEGVLKTDKDFLGVVFKGVGPEYDRNFIKENLIEGEMPQFSASESQNKIVISEVIAKKLNLHVGNKIFAYFLNEQGLRTRNLKIAGIYATNMKQFDSQICFIDIYTAQKLNGWKEDQYGGVELLIKDFNNLSVEASKILHLVKNKKDKYNNTYSSSDVISLYPQIFSWLDLMDMNVWIILGLMIAVAGVTMVSGLLIIILERTQMIGIMKALGSHNKQIRHIFLWFAIFVIGKGLLLGNLIGLGLVLLQRYTGFIKLDPQTYYVSTIPIEVNILFILALNIITLIICVLVLIAPSYLVSRINPVKAMRYE